MRKKKENSKWLAQKLWKNKCKKTAEKCDFKEIEEESYDLWKIKNWFLSLSDTAYNRQPSQSKLSSEISTTFSFSTRTNFSCQPTRLCRRFVNAQMTSLSPFFRRKVFHSNKDEQSEGEFFWIILLCLRRSQVSSFHDFSKWKHLQSASWACV